MTFSGINFEPDDHIVCQAANPDGHLSPLGPGDLRQFLYICQPRQTDQHARPFEADVWLTDAREQDLSSLPLGRLDLQWSTAGGEPGKLQTATLSRKVTNTSPVAAVGYVAPDYDIALIVDNISHPAPLHPEQAFAVSFRAQIKPRANSLKGKVMAQHITHHAASKVDTDQATLKPSSEPVYPPPRPINPGSVMSSSSLIYLGPSLVEACQETDGTYTFSQTFLATADGLINIGGLRLLLEDNDATVVRLGEWSCVAQVQVAASHGSP